MTQITDVSKESTEIIKIVNRDNLYKEVRIYSYKNLRVIYCITNKGALHISASTPLGPATKKDLIYVFQNLTDKSIFDFEFVTTDRAVYLIESFSEFIDKIWKEGYYGL